MPLGNVTDSIPVLNRDLGERLGPVCNLINTYLHSETNRKKNETENLIAKRRLQSQTMIAPRNLVLLQFILITVALNGLLNSCTGDSSKTDKIVELQKSKSGQIYQWSEAEGKEFLSQMRQSNPTPEAWEKTCAVSGIRDLELAEAAQGISP